MTQTKPTAGLLGEKITLGELVTEAHEVLHNTGLTPRELADKADAGEKFKTFVHAYLDEHGVTHGDPSNQHQIEGCRIGARLDLMFAERDQLAERVTTLEGERAEVLEKLKLALPHIAHELSCCQINSARDWATKGSVTTEGCACDRKAITTLIAKLEGAQGA